MMKKIIILLLVALSFVGFSVEAQTEVVNISDAPTYTGCDFIMHDNAGGLAPYATDAFNVVTICSTAGNQVNLYFLTFILSPGDLFTVYDGPTASDPAIGTYSGSDLQFQTISSTNASGCLTVFFLANGDDQVGDFIMQGSCGVPCLFPLAAITASEPSPFLGCPSEQITFDGSTSVFPNGAALYSHNWDFGDGTSDNVSWPTVTHSYTQPGIYHVVLTITVLSADGVQQCSNLNVGDYFVYISTPIEWNTTVSDLSVCVGVEVNAGAPDWVATPDLGIQDSPANASFSTFVLAPESNLGDGVYIPDNQGCFEATLTFENLVDTTITNINQIIGITANLEHSFASDIVINIICPQGNTLQLSNGNSGGGIFLGEPIDVENPNQPGVGYDYTWDPLAATTFNTAISTAAGTLPAGSYNADGSGAVPSYPLTNNWVNQTWGALMGCTLNGTWQFQICDQVGSDDGFIFDWTIQFSPESYPTTLSFTPEALPGQHDSFWSPDGNLTFQDANMNNVIFMSNTQGTFPLTYQVTSDFGCTYDTTFNITVYGPPTVDLPNSMYFCNVDTDLEPVYGNALPNTNYAYSWSPASNVTVPNIAFPQATNVPDSTWISVVSWPTYDNTCTGTDSVYVLIPNAPDSTEATYPICLSEQIDLNLPALINSNSYNWYSDSITQITLGTNQSFQTPLPGSGVESLIYYLEASEGICGFKSTSEYTIEYLPCEVFLPNVLNINQQDDYNNDALNFGDALFYYSNAAVQVFNRWGDLVYESSNYKNNWIPSDLSDGVYYYTLSVTTPTGTIEGYRSYFHLMRKSQ